MNKISDAKRKASASVLHWQLICVAKLSQELLYKAIKQLANEWNQWMSLGMVTYFKYLKEFYYFSNEINLK